MTSNAFAGLFSVVAIVGAIFYIIWLFFLKDRMAFKIIFGVKVNSLEEIKIMAIKPIIKLREKQVKLVKAERDALVVKIQTTNSEDLA